MFSIFTKTMVATLAVSTATLTVAAGNYQDGETSAQQAVSDESEDTIYTADFKQNDGGFTTDNETVWKSLDSNWGWKGTGRLGATIIAALDAYLTSSEIDLTGYKDATLSFSHVVSGSRQYTPSDVLFVEVVDGDKVTELNDKVTWPAGTDFTPVNSGKVSLKDFVGKKIKVQFHYTCTTVEACVWAIQNMTITGVESGNGIQSVTTSKGLDLTQPYEMYTLGGTKATDNAGHGLRIIKQGGKTWKLMK